MSEHDNKYILPKNTERYLAALSRYYAQEGLPLYKEIIVNALIRIHEEWNIDNFFDGTHYGHALYLVLPEALYLRHVKNKDTLQKKIKADLNTIHNVHDESYDEVFLEIEEGDIHDWRQESGLLLSRIRIVSHEAKQRIWDEDKYRVFLSHKSEVKSDSAALKRRLSAYGVSGFVAHEDIYPTQEWQDEIENALSTMDAFVALLTDDFHDSEWTDQEVGYAIGRGVPIIPVKLGRDPYGFIGKYQALSCSWDIVAQELVSVLIKHDQMLNAFIRTVQSCGSWEQGNNLANILPHIDGLSVQQADILAAAFNENAEIRGAYGFNGKHPTYYGQGLAYHLCRLTGLDYKLMDDTLTKGGYVVTSNEANDVPF